MDYVEVRGYSENEFDPYPHRGYIIQAHPDGWFYVIDRLDRKGQSALRFLSLEQAVDYIDNLSSGGIY